MIEKRKGHVNEMKRYLASDIPVDNFFTKTVYLDPSFILAAPEMPFSAELAKTIADWGFTEVFSDGEPLEDYVSYPPAEGAASNFSTTSDPDKIQEAEEFYANLQKYVEHLFSRIKIKRTLVFTPIAEKMKAVVDFVREERRFLMLAQKKAGAPPDKNYLASHSVRSTVIAIIIGTYLKLPVHRLIELGVAALLHEIGMLHLPSRYYLSNRPLTAEEHTAILDHPVQSYTILKSYDFPLVVSVAALEHHERENGSGYPQHLPGGKISLYAKIIAVACSYEALSSGRPHKEAKDGYTGMLELLKNEGGQYDDTIVRALVFSLSIYPIGLYVLLSSGKKGQVVDVNPEHPRYPIVQIFGELTPDGKNKTVQTSAGGLSIVRPLTREEINN